MAEMEPLLRRARKEGSCFVRTWTGFTHPTVWGLLKWQAQNISNPPEKPPEERDLNAMHPVLPPHFSPSPSSGLTLTWIGHATVLIEMEGYRILTDPVFSHRIGSSKYTQHVNFFGPTRLRPPACRVDELPEIDAVLISHNHYDHLDYPTIKSLLQQKYGTELKFFAPFGLKSWLEKSGCLAENVEELNWTDEKHLGSLKVVFTPSQHWSGRGPRDTDQVLWGSWCILGETHRFFFAGDTGYHEQLFKEIGEQYGPFNGAAIPIGAYSPRWFMQNQHVDPEEAVKIHQDIKCQKSLGIHWGTFHLSSEPFLEPPERIKRLASETFITTKIGETVNFT